MANEFEFLKSLLSDYNSYFMNVYNLVLFWLKIPVGLQSGLSIDLTK